MIEKGALLRCQTKTRGDVFGDVLWEVVETGLPAPEADRKGQTDGIKCVMLGGSGPRARTGLTVIDSEWHVKQDIAMGITNVVPAAQKDAILSHYKGSGPSAAGMERKHTGTGVVEL